LGDAGVSLDDVVKVTVTFRRGEDFEAVKRVFRKYFGNRFPARNTILVDGFLNPDIRVQIEAIAYKPQKQPIFERFRRSVSFTRIIWCACFLVLNFRALSFRPVETLINEEAFLFAKFKS